MRVVDVPLAIGHRNANRVAQSGQLLAVLQVVGNVGMTRGDHIFETGVQLQAHRLPAQQHGCQQAQQQDQTAVVEQRPLDQ
ncbi:hypothetical protein D3C84_496820 [compost metagenome]